MEYWRMNTDRDARTDVATCDLWYHYGMAFVGDFEEIGPYNHATVFPNLAVGDGIFMHHNKSGLVGFGIVQEPWDECIYRGDERLLYKKEVYEYRIRVNWLSEYDRRAKPISISGRLHYRGYYSYVDLNRWDVKGILRDMMLDGYTQDRSFADDVSLDAFLEGAKMSSQIQTYAYNQSARRRCIEAYGFRCSVCGFDFYEVYGAIGWEYIQVHHLVPLSTINEEHEVDPVKDLRPVCANCHVMLHRRQKQPYTIEELRSHLKK